ncbi:MAG: class I SAM-dependent methyltransferase [Candidatus Pacearchaeota archaeon]
MNDYSYFAKYYDLLYSNKNYKQESQKLAKILEKTLKTAGKEILEVACGTGEHIKYLKNRFKFTGIDLDKNMLKIARNKNPQVHFKVADMKSFSMNKKFDAITCLFSSIGYVENRQELRKTIENFSNHLKEGGALVIEPLFTKDTFPKNFRHLRCYDGDSVKLSRLLKANFKGNYVFLDSYYTLSEGKSKQVKQWHDRHRLFLFTQKELLKILEEAGFKAKYRKKGLSGRGLFVAINIQNL